ncbi:MAG: Rrf2 family transcriptional regulator [bacterium]
MQVSRELDYGMRAMVVLSKHEGTVLSKKTIAGEFGIPVNFLALILPKLVRHGLVESLPGPRGGYRLAMSPSGISLYDVFCAMDQNLTINQCLDPSTGCDMKDQCPVSPVWKELQERSIEYLKGVTFAGLLSRHKA